MVRIVKYSGRLFIGMIAGLLIAGTAGATVMCIDIETEQGAERILELAISSVEGNSNYFQLNGSLLDANGAETGSAVGSAKMVNNAKILLNVHASQIISSIMTATNYQFEFSVANLAGDYQSLSQQSFNNGTFNHQSGNAALITDCDSPPTDFSGPDFVTLDADGDGYISEEHGGDDCNDHDPFTNPGADEICGDGIDNNCRAGADNRFSECQGQPVDSDGDGVIEGDCAPFDRTVYPGATELCDGLLQDCNGVIDAGCYPDFRDNNNGTISQDSSVITQNEHHDIRSNLMWQAQHYDQEDPSNPDLNWGGAVRHCDDLTLAGYSDWRLPTRDELVSLLDFRVEPYIDQDYFSFGNRTFLSITLNQFDYAYGVDYLVGEVKTTGKLNLGNPVRCVRDN